MICMTTPIEPGDRVRVRFDAHSAYSGSVGNVVRVDPSHPLPIQVSFYPKGQWGPGFLREELDVVPVGTPVRLVLTP